MRTVDEKYNYNKQRKDKSPFSSGYCAGVTMYGEWSNMSKSDKRAARQYIDNAKELARQGDQLSKGIMCGIRDAANERKSKGK